MKLYDDLSDQAAFDHCVDIAAQLLQEYGPVLLKHKQTIPENENKKEILRPLESEKEACCILICNVIRWMYGKVLLSAHEGCAKGECSYGQKNLLQIRFTQKALISASIRWILKSNVFL